jgi:hypothetical protein
MAEPDRQKMMMRLNNLNVTLESLYRLAWQDGFEAGIKECARPAEIESLKELKGEFKLGNSTSEAISKYLDNVYEKDSEND